MECLQCSTTIHQLRLVNDEQTFVVGIYKQHRHSFFNVNADVFSLYSSSISTGGGRGGMMSFGVERKDNLGAREAL